MQNIHFVCKGLLLNKVTIEGRIDNFLEISSVVLLLRSGRKVYGCKLNEIINEGTAV